MQNPATQLFVDPDVANLLASIYETSLQPAIHSRQYNGLTAVIKVLASIHPADRKAILSLLNAEKQPRTPSTKKDASRFLSAPKGKKKPPYNPKNPDCPYCPDDEIVPVKVASPTALQVLEEMHSGEAALPAELFEGEPRTADRKTIKNFKDGETIEEVLKAHGQGEPGMDGQEVRARLLATLELVRQHIEYDRRWGVEKLAGAILQSKGIDPNE